MTIPHLMSVHVSAVHGGSGRRYGSISEAVENEQEVVPVDFVPQAGTSSGILVGPSTLSAVDNAYRGYVVVNMDTTPSFGLVCRNSVVTSYVGATRTFTLNTAVNFVAESTIRLIQPIHVNLDGDTTTSPIQETLRIEKNIVINTSGFRISGGIDFAGTYCEFRGAGQVTNGIQMVSMGALIIEDTKVSRREGTIYSVLLTEGANHGRCVISGSTGNGRVAARRGFMGWEVSGSRNYGVIDANGNNIPYALVESVAGIPVVMSQLDVSIFGEFSGAFVYSENSITGSPEIKSQGNAFLPIEDLFNTPIRTNRMFRYFWCGAGGSMTLSPMAASQMNLNVEYYGPQGGAEANATQLATSVIAFIETFNHVAPAVCSITLGSIAILKLSTLSGYSSSVVECTGTVTQTGNVTLSGSSAIIDVASPGSRIFFVDLAVPCDGSTITVSSQLTVTSGTTPIVGAIVFKASQTVGVGPTVVLSSTVFTYSSIVFGISSFLSGLTIALGTYTISGIWNIRQSQTATLYSIGTGYTGGTYTISGRHLIGIAVTERTTGFKIADVNAAAGSFTVSGLISCVGSQGASFQILFMRGGASTINVSSSEVRIKGFMFEGESGYGAIVVDNRGTGGSATLSGFVTYEDCFFANPAGGTVSIIGHASGGTAGKATTGPSRVEFINTNFTVPLIDFDLGAGTLTWANATLRFRGSICEELVTLDGDFYSTVESMESQFFGNTLNESVTMSGVRPATYRYWKCTRRALISDNLPEIIDDYEVRPSDGAVAAGAICTVNAAGQATPALAGTTYLAGVNLIATTGANEPAVIVKSGMVFVDSDGAVVAGNVCINDAAGVPTEQIAGAPVVGRTVGIAMEATNATRAGEAYTFVDMK